MMTTHASAIKRNDVTFIYDGEVKTIVHKNASFNPIQLNKYESINTLIELYKTPTTDIRVMMDTLNAYYFVVCGEVVIENPYAQFNEAVDAAKYWEKHINEWTNRQKQKGWSKKYFMDNVKSNNMQGKKIFTTMKDKKLDEEFYPIKKLERRGCVDIVRNNCPSAIFYVDMPAILMLYTENNLKIFNPGFRLWNEKERKCIEDWEKQRDRMAEYVDAISDGSQEYYRKKYFFERRGCSHLIGQRYNGIIKDNTTRGQLVLEYELKQ